MKIPEYNIIINQISEYIDMNLSQNDQLPGQKELIRKIKSIKEKIEKYSTILEVDSVFGIILEKKVLKVIHEYEEYKKIIDIPVLR